MSRYYNSDTGRFLNRDSFHGFENEPLSLNQYSYTKNDPVNNIDPDGYFTKKFNLGFYGYVKIHVSWHSVGVSLNVTPGALINVGIGVAAGGSAKYLINKFLRYWLWPNLANLTFIWVANKVVNALAKKVSQSSFRKITKGYRWLYKSLWYKSYSYSW